MTPERHELPRGLERPRALLATGLGPLLSAERAGRPVLVQLLPGTSPGALSPDVQRRLAAPPHPVLLPVEVGAAASGSVAVAPLEGTPLALLPAGERLTPARAVEAGLALAAAALALAHAGSRLGPLTPHNVLVDPSAPLPLRVLPLAPFFPGPSGIAGHAPDDLLLVDRETLRGAPGPASDPFAIGALLLLACHGRDAFPAIPATAQALVREAVLTGHPLARSPLPAGPLAEVLAAALRPGGGDEAPLAALHDALRAAAEGADPLARALGLAARGDPLAALAVLHRARDAAAPPLAALLLKARLEESLGRGERAARTLHEAHEAFPASAEVAERLGHLVSDTARAAAFREEAFRLGATPARRLARAGAALAEGRLAAAAEDAERVRLAALIDPSLARLGLAASLALARPLREAGRHEAALAVLTAPGWEVDGVDDADLAASLDEARGHARFGLGAYAEAALAFRSACEREEARGAPRPALLGELAHALVAAGRREEARRAVLRSLELDPSQERMRRLLAALAEGPG